MLETLFSTAAASSAVTRRTFTMSIAFFDSTKVLDALARSGVAEVTVQRGSGGAMNASGTTVMAVPSAKAAVALLQRADRRLAALPSACHEVVTLCVTSQDTQQGEPVHSKLHFVALSRGRCVLLAVAVVCVCGRCFGCVSLWPWLWLWLCVWLCGCGCAWGCVCSCGCVAVAAAVAMAVLLWLCVCGCVAVAVAVAVAVLLWLCVCRDSWCGWCTAHQVLAVSASVGGFSPHSQRRGVHGVRMRRQSRRQRWRLVRRCVTVSHRTRSSVRGAAVAVGGARTGRGGRRGEVCRLRHRAA